MKYAIDGFTSQEAIDYIETSAIKKLIYELNYKYGLKVLCMQVTLKQTYIFLTDKTGAFVVSRVWLEIAGNDNIFYFRSPYFVKNRGRTREDKETFFSKKLSSLMGAISRNNVIPDETKILEFYKQDIIYASSVLSSSFPNTYKRDELNAQEEHMLLKYALGETTELLIIDKCKKLLDKYNKQDKIKEEIDKRVDLFFGNGFYAIGVDTFDHLVIGKLSYDKVDGIVSKEKCSVLEPFERVKDLSKHEHLQVIMTMNKVYHEQRGKNEFRGGYVPYFKGYLEDLDIVYVAGHESGDRAFNWMFIPCTNNT